MPWLYDAKKLAIAWAIFIAAAIATWAYAEFSTPSRQQLQFVTQSENKYSYQDLARDKAAECIRNKGGGEWRAALGISLKDFCRFYGTMKAHEQFCREHPQSC